MMNIDVLRNSNTNLPGGLSTDEYFFYVDTNDDDAVPNYSSVSNFISKENFKEDPVNKIYIGSEGAVCDAYSFADMNQDEIEQNISQIIMEKKQIYPDYDFKIVPGNFPISVEGGYFCNGRQINSPEAKMSTHILYITDYDKHLVETEEKSARI